MKFIYLFSLLILFAVNTFGQDFSKLTYPELDSLRLLYRKNGEFAKGIPLLEAGLKKAKADFGTQDSMYAVYVNNLGLFYLRLGQHDKAESYYKESISLDKAIFGVNHPEYASSLNNLGILYLNMGRFEESEPLLLKAKAARKQIFGAEHNDYAKSLNNLASLYISMERYSEAEPLLWESAAIRKKLLGAEHSDYAMSLTNIASLFMSLNRFAEAEPLFLESMTIRKKTMEVTDPAYTGNLNNLALLYKKTSRYKDAEKLYLDCLFIRKKMLGTSHPSYANSLSNLAALYMEMKPPRNQDAEKLLLEGIAINEKNGSSAHDGGMMMLNLATLYIRMNRLEDAWQYNYQALRVASRLNHIGTNITTTWADSILQVNYTSIELLNYVLENYYILLKMDTSTEARSKKLIIVNLAMQVLKKIRDNYTSTDDKLRTLSLNSAWALRSLESLDKKTQVAEAFAFAEQSKSVLLMDAARAEHAHSFGDLPDSLVQQELTLQKTHSQYEAALTENRPEAEKEELRVLLNNLNSDINVFKKNIEKKYPKYAALKYKHREISTSEVQKILDDSTALLEYVVGDSAVFVFYIDHKNLRLFLHAIPKSELTLKIKELHNALSDYEFILKKADIAYRQYAETAHWFYKNLVSIALTNSKNIKHLIIVTDGELGFLPFETFLVEQAPQKEGSYANLHYLVKDYRISYNYSATLFADAVQESKISKKNNGQILAMAANYSISLKNKDLRLPVYTRLRANLNELPEAQKEVEVLSKQFQGYFGLNEMASEKVFKEKAADFGIIHLAMHGLLDNKNPILSSLAFTEDGDSVENNFLQAYEISKMKLNADLIVLSACETGYGKFEKGNGVASLARAFMYAGASSLVVSLWQVSDYATAEIMKDFYANLANGMDKAEALRQAKLKYIQQAQGVAAHPAFWSPFIQFGDSRAIYVETQFIASKTWWAIGIIALLIITAIIIILRKRQQ